MKMEDQNMDDLFRRAAEDLQANYRANFWKDMEAQLADEALDSAFRNAASETAFTLPENLTESLDDAFLDEAFRDAASQTTFAYTPEFWTEFASQRSILEQNISFVEAANALRADYHPAYWQAADIALQDEGLHYEYKSEYWGEARRLLDRADRSVFFTRWSAVAALLLLISFGGLMIPSVSTETANAPLVQNTLHSTTNPDFAVLYPHLQDNSSAHEETPLTPNHTTNQNISHNSANLNMASLNPSLALSHDPVISITSGSENNSAHNLTTDPSNLINPATGFSASQQPEHFDGQYTDPDHSSQQPPLLVGDDNLSLQKLPIAGMPQFEVNTEYSGPQIEIQRAISKPTNQFYVFANSGIGNKYGQPNFVPTWRTGGGFEYLHTTFGRLRNFEFGGSVAINHVRQNDFGTERRVSVYNTHGGIDKFWYKLQIKDMIYSNLSAIVSYRISRMQKIRFSVGADYLVFVQSNMSYQNQPDMAITTVNNNWGIKEGVNKLDLKLGIGYELQVGKRWTLQANGNFGLFDRSDDDFIAEKSFDHELNATLGIKYTLLRKP